MDILEEIKDDKQVFDNYFNKMTPEKQKFFTRENEDVTTIVNHGTGGGGTWTALKRYVRTAGGRYKRGVGLFPILLARNGTASLLHDLLHWFFHSSSGNDENDIPIDKSTIGIEWMNTGMNRGAYTEEQYESAFQIYDLLIELFPNINTITGHDFLKIKAGGRPKGCPGKKFDWNRVEDYIVNKYGNKIGVKW